MKSLSSFVREVNFMRHNRAVIMTLSCAFILSGLAVIGGLYELQRQQETIANIKAADYEDRTAVLAEQDTWGGAAYYSFHLTYNPPDDFAFAAMGQRDTHPWKHRIRMLAIEGQIYERDTNNPIIALIGRFDFSFFAAFVLPFLIIILLHDIRASEKRAGRFYLLLASAEKTTNLWLIRTLVLSLSLYMCVLIPLIIGGIINHVSISVIMTAAFYLFLYVTFWTLISYWFASWNKSTSFILASLIGFWIMVAVLIPTGTRMVIDGAVPVPSGAEILMKQRETVNGAWDIPKEETMQVFLERYPEWSAYAAIDRPFEWKWYFAFQEVGDLKTENLSQAFREGRLKRDRLAGYGSLIAPPVLFERALQSLAKTDTRSNLAFEEKVREFHAQLRQFYYPQLFKNEPFDGDLLEELPSF